MNTVKYMGRFGNLSRTDPYTSDIVTDFITQNQDI
jgi:hypothetical protein